MKVVIAHYHLQTGGVTRVVQQAVQALAEHGVKTLVLSGEPPAEPFPAGTEVRVIPALAYEERRPPTSGAALAAAMMETARTVLGGPPDLWHIHNHCLGKNLAMPEAVRRLAQEGQALLLQIHDFAEDGRPALYERMLRELAAGDHARLSALLYPLAGRIHYAALNGRDLAFLDSTGIPATVLHLLPNAVWIAPGERAADRPGFDGRRLWLYPTRAIRRKNLGELLLWAALAADGDLFAATQAPQNPLERPYYRRWVEFAEDLGLPVSFALGTTFSGDFRQLLGSAHALISTSVAEGFGLAFLEPWLIGRPLAGRDLPEITRDFTAVGVDLGALYPRLDVPLDWVDRKRLTLRIRTALENSLKAYGRQPRAADFQQAFAAFVQADQVDFGRLDEPLQEPVIRTLATSATARGELPNAPSALRPDCAAIEPNRALIRQNFGIDHYGERLLGIYRALRECPPGPLSAASGEALLDHFLDPKRLFLLRT